MDGEADGDTDADGVGVGVADGVVVLAASSRTWRSRSNAVWPTIDATFCAPAPGTETTMPVGPCCTTDAPDRPVASTRFVMIWIDLVIAACVTLPPPSGIA